MYHKEYDNLLLDVKLLREKLVQMDEELQHYRTRSYKGYGNEGIEAYAEFKRQEKLRAEVRNELKHKNVRISELQRLMRQERQIENERRSNLFLQRFKDNARLIISDDQYEIILKMTMDGETQCLNK
ncbi:hypothetical protein LAV73_06695 [Lysinibacillus xylanilyticus]|uniref:hypothetical protein n=1 Tax=Lysinibacillus xylanilyticus TaxID=582475 RepID=UPI002B25003D|nr:hypothetical protein [Lysinibacillus xylanilyticus]MEB2279688.1 hypothetical protein [Lysinibacillus xylanilyticus]